MTDTNVTPPPTPEAPPPPLPPQTPLPVMSYAAPGPSNQPAVLSFVFGLLVLVPLAVPGILAVLFGRRGLKMAREHGAGRAGLAKLGIVLGAINIVLSLLFAASLPFALVKARVQSRQVACAANLRALSQAAMVYAVQNRGALPLTIDHLAGAFPGGAGGGGAARLFTCPACAGNPAKPPVVVGATVNSHYHLLVPAARISQVKQPQNVVLLYEPLTHHDNRGMNIAFCDGHVEFVGGALASKIAAELAAGQNPPPSKP
jgi:prepilin-type processing-associated H-X9-DG protein